jgi:predicted dinucleotide-binding enzyme
MTVGIVGAGRMGRALADATAGAGLPAVLVPGRGDPRRAAGLLAPCGVVVLAVPLPAVFEFLRGPAGLDGRGRTLIDPTNPDGDACPPPGRSAGELVSEAAAGRWRVVKAFNTVPARALTRCRLNGLPVSLPIASDHPAALRDAGALARALGFEPLDAGDMRTARHLEALAALLMAVSDRHRLHGGISIRIGVPAPLSPVRAAVCQAS